MIFTVFHFFLTKNNFFKENLAAKTENYQLKFGKILKAQIWYPGWFGHSKFYGSCHFLVLGQNYLFWLNYAHKLKIVGLGWNLVDTLTRMFRGQWWCSLFLFLAENTLLSKFDSRHQNYLLNLKFWCRD